MIDKEREIQDEIEVNEYINRGEKGTQITKKSTGRLKKQFIIILTLVMVVSLCTGGYCLHENSTSVSAAQTDYISGLTGQEPIESADEPGTGTTTGTGAEQRQSLILDNNQQVDQDEDFIPEYKIDIIKKAGINQESVAKEASQESAATNQESVAEEANQESEAAVVTITEVGVLASSNDEIVEPSLETELDNTMVGLELEDNMTDEIAEQTLLDGIEDNALILMQLMGADDYGFDELAVPDYLTKTYNPDMVMNPSEESKKALLTLVEAEAPSEDIIGKILVANVVLNRVLSSKKDLTIKDIIFEKIGGCRQFEPTGISWYWDSIEVTDSTREAVARALSGEDYSQGATYFYAWRKSTEQKAKETLIN